MVLIECRLSTVTVNHMILIKNTRDNRIGCQVFFSSDDNIDGKWIKMTFGDVEIKKVSPVDYTLGHY